MSDGALAQEAHVSQEVTLKLLDTILADFGLARNNGTSTIELEGAIPALQQTKSQHIMMSLVGAIPSLGNAIAATQIFEARGGDPQTIAIDLRKAHNYLDPDIGMTPTINGQEITLDLVAGNPFLQGIYETADGRHVVPSAVYVDLVYQWSTLLDCGVNSTAVAEAIKGWTAADLEKAAEIAGMPIAVIQSAETWQETEQGKIMASQPIVPVKKVSDAPPKQLSPNPKRPLEGLKVMCVAHAIAGPSAGRTLAEHGASVLQIMYTHGFEHPFVYQYANLGCASTRLNLNSDEGRSQMWKLVREADVWIDSYREGALSKFGFTDEKLIEANPSLIVSHVRLYGVNGPWTMKPGFDMQGSASSGMMALCGGGLKTPAWPPGMVINDYTTGYYGALAIQATLLRQLKEGGGYILGPSLAGTGMSIVKHFKSSDYPQFENSQTNKLPPHEVHGETNLGYLKTVGPLPVLSKTPLGYDPVLLSPLGSDIPVFPGTGAHFDVDAVKPTAKEEVMGHMVHSTNKRVAELRLIGKSHFRSNNQS